MGSQATAVADAPAASPPLPIARLIGVGLVVFFANAALLVLQLLASRLLDPFVGSSLETWTSIIGVFLAGIALGNAYGGRLADRYPTPRTLTVLLAAGAIAAFWMVIFPLILSGTGVYKSIPLGPRIPVLALFLCLPAGFVLSLLTPLAIKLGVPDVSKTGRVVGLVFSLSTLGCILGNYLTGFVLIPMFYINTLVLIAACILGALSLCSVLLLGTRSAVEPSGEAAALPASAPESPPETETNPYAFADIRTAFLIVFLSSFGGMTLELTASRVLAQHLGVSLFTWTGVIGVMLAGTALGNLTGGLIADRVNRSSTINPRNILGGSLLVAGAASVFQIVCHGLISTYEPFLEYDLIVQVVGWTFCIFFLPMFALGTISPQVIRLAVPDVAHVGRVAGRVYAWSTAGAIVGTFVTGYVLISAIGTTNVIVSVALVLALTSLMAANVWSSSPLLYVFAIVLGGITGGTILSYRTGSRDEEFIAVKETNYYTIKVTKALEEKMDRFGNYLVDELGRQLYVWNGKLNLTLDHLMHSRVDPNDASYLHYRHEHVQMDFVSLARTQTAEPHVLVIGGGGYTFPRYTMQQLPETRMDVVEIDPGVTEVARKHLGLQDYAGMKIHHMDGRQFVAEKAPARTYDLVVLDAVNDLSVPAHLLTKEYNDAVKAALKPNGVYLLTVIDSIGKGKLWKAAVHTLAQTFPADNIGVLAPVELNASGKQVLDYRGRQVYVIYASDRPLDLAAIDALFAQPAMDRQTGAAAAAGGLAASTIAIPSGHTCRLPAEDLKPYLDAGPKIVLTDQFAPVDNLMADVFRDR